MNINDSVFHPQYGNGTIQKSSDTNCEVLLLNGEHKNLPTEELFYSYQEWTERNTPDYHR